MLPMMNDTRRKGPPYIASYQAMLMPLGPVAPRRMFGGWGIFLDGIMFALVADGDLYLKADAENEATFRQAKAKQFTYNAKGKAVAMSYWRPPATVMKDFDRFTAWAESALAAARRSKKSRSRS